MDPELHKNEDVRFFENVYAYIDDLLGLWKVLLKNNNWSIVILWKINHLYIVGLTIVGSYCCTGLLRQATGPPPSGAGVGVGMLKEAGAPLLENKNKQSYLFICCICSVRLVLFPFLFWFV